jgi:hypothetical protein
LSKERINCTAVLGKRELINDDLVDRLTVVENLEETEKAWAKA